MEPRLTGRTLVQILLRLCEQDGGFGTVIARGDPDAGAVILVLVERGERRQLLERVLQPNGEYAWGESGSAQNDFDLDKFLDRRRQFDPDLWILELDVASAERFTAQLAALD